MAVKAQVLDRDESKHLEYEISEWAQTPGGWTVEAIGGDGEIYQAFFYGPKAKARAEEYRIFKSAQ